MGQKFFKVSKAIFTKGKSASQGLEAGSHLPVIRDLKIQDGREDDAAPKDGKDWA